MKKIFLPLIICSIITACTDDSADSDGNGIIDTDERKSEMLSDAFIEVEAGLWETTTNFTDIDMPAISGARKEKLLKQISQGFSSQTCISEEEAKEPDADFFGGDGSENCEYERFDMSGQLAEIIVNCKVDNIGAAQIHLNGKIDSKEHVFDTKLTMKMPGLGDIVMDGTVQRNHIGYCPTD